MAFAAHIAAADRAVLQHLGEDGLIRYAPSVGDAVDVKGVFDASYVQVNAGQAGVVSSGPAVFLMVADLPTNPEEDDPIITVAGVAYRVREPKSDGKGGVVLLLHEA